MSVTDIITTELTAPPGPLRWPQARTNDERQLAHELRGHVSAASWLPKAGLGDWIVELRARHHETRNRAAREIAQIAVLTKAYGAEDRRHVEALAVAVGKGQPSPEDQRTPAPQREQALADAHDRAWLAAKALAEFIKDARREIADHADEAANVLGARLLAAREDRRQAELVLARAAAEEAGVAALDTWLRNTLKGGALSSQPAPGVAA
jgi:hypothetical protein